MIVHRGQGPGLFIRDRDQSQSWTSDGKRSVIIVSPSRYNILPTITGRAKMSKFYRDHFGFYHDVVYNTTARMVQTMEDALRVIRADVGLQ